MKRLGRRLRASSAALRRGLAASQGNVSRGRRPSFELLEDRRVFAIQVDVLENAISELNGSSLATISRNGSLSQPLAVTISSSDSSEAAIALWSGVIPANAASVNIVVNAVNDDVVDGRRSVTITATAVGHGTAMDTVVVLDDDGAALTPAPATDVVTLTPGPVPNQYRLNVDAGRAAGVGDSIYATFTQGGTWQTGGFNQSIEADKFMRVDAQSYVLSGWAKSGDEFGERYSAGNRQSFGLIGYDVDKLPIRAEHTQKFGNAADTKLAAPLNPGDTVIRLVSAAGWSNAAGAAAGTRGIAWYGYANSAGQTYADYSYTRNVALGGANGLWNPGGVSGNVITLAAPWSGPALPAGAAVRNTGDGDDELALALDSQAVPGDWTWTNYRASFNAADYPGLYYVKPFIRANEQGGFENFVSWRNVSLTPTANSADWTPPVYDLSTVTGFDQRRSLTMGGGPTQWSENLVRVNASASYDLSGWALNASTLDETPLGFASFDVDRKLIHPLHVTRYAYAVDTTLAAPLLPGATSMLLTNASGWSNDVWETGETRSLAWYGYADSTGQTYANYTYTRNVAYDFDNGLWAPGAIRYDAAAGAYRIDLREPWSGPALAAGAAIRNAASGNVLSEPTVAPAVVNVQVHPTEKYAATIGGGVWQQGQRSENAFRPGTAYIQPTFKHVALWQGAIEPAGNVERTKALETLPDGAVVLELDVLAKGLVSGNSAATLEGIDAEFGTATLLPAVGANGRPMIRYVAPAGFAGSDVVSYVVRPAGGEPVRASVKINVLGGASPSSPPAGAEAPKAIGDTQNSYSVVAGGTLVVDGVALPSLLANDSDPVDPLTSRLLQGPRHGSLRLNSAGTFVYIPAPGFVGTDTFQYEATDGGKSTAAFASITVYATAEELTLANLRIIGFAALNYESAKNKFMLDGANAAHYNASGNPYLSWRVHLLPYLGYQSLYAQFRLNEAWNSPHNLPLAAKLPAVYRDASGAAGGDKTRVQMFEAEGAEYYWRRSSTGRLIGPSSSQVADGLDNTLLAVESPASLAVVWTRPDDLAFDPSNPLAAWGSVPRGGINAVTMAGLTVTLPRSITAGEFKEIVTVAGGELSDMGTLRRRHAEENGGQAAAFSYGSYVEDNNLRQIYLGMNNYESAKLAFPFTMSSTAFDANGVPYLSWRVHILPYLGYSTLYSKFKINEPWDSPNNLPLLNEMPDVFRSAGDSSTSTTSRLLTFFGAQSTFRPALLGPGTGTGGVRGTTAASIRDGFENTLLVVEAGVDKATPWTKQGELDYTPTIDLSALGNTEAGEFRAVFFAGNTISVSVDMPATTFRALATRAGGEHVDAKSVATRENQRRGVVGSSTYQSNDVHKFKGIELAMIDYENANKRFPANTFDSSGKPLLSWRVMILPYLGFSSLYQQFRRNEPWDSPHNLSLLPLMPDVFRTTGDAWNSMTTQVTTFIGEGAPFPATGVNGNGGPTHAQFWDGTSNTISIVQGGADRAVPWTKPSDTPFNANNPYSELGELGPNFIAGMADGSVRTFPSSTSAAELKAYITHRGEEVPGSAPPLNTVPAITVRQPAGDTSLSEIGVDWFDVVLDKAPEANVVITLSLTGGAAATLDRTSLTFTPTNWNVAQRVAVRGVNNQTVEEDRSVVVTLMSPSLPTKTVTALVRNDDVASLAADFSGDGRVDGSDFLRWQRNFGVYGTAVAAHGDATQDKAVGQSDLVAWKAQYGSSGTPPTPGDFNDDGGADGADLAVWKANFGRTAGVAFESGDGDFDGDIDGNDFLAWQRAAGTGGVIVASLMASAEVVPPEEIGDSPLLPAADVTPSSSLRPAAIVLPPMTLAFDAALEGREKASRSTPAGLLREVRATATAALRTTEKERAFAAFASAPSGRMERAGDFDRGAALGSSDSVEQCFDEAGEEESWNGWSAAAFVE